LNYSIRNANNELITNQSTLFNFKLRQVAYDTTNGDYNLGTIWAEEDGDGFLQFNKKPEEMTEDEASTHADVGIPAANFKDKEIKLVISFPNNTSSTTYYIEKMELYKAVEKTTGEYFSPGELDEEGIITSTYNFFS
jgi:hypothetical protein